SINPFQPVDLASLAVELGATFVAQSFSGDKQQLVPLIKAAIQHRGLAFINVMSPCVTFNNNPGSTKSYDYVREHMHATGTLDFVPEEKEITAAYREGTEVEVEMHDGTMMKFHKLAPDWNPEDRLSAFNAMQQARVRNEILTGLLYINTEFGDLHQTLGTSDTAFNQLTEKELCPGTEILNEINEGLR
ncbi:MAG: 2-oxoacid:ferredoxin oxidoreductase subunit beta, partial [Cyclobacteriaceae bacterium]